MLVSRTHPGYAFLTHPPQSAFDAILLKVFFDPTGLRFIQIGANDGHLADPLSGYLDDFGWQGAMFEPLAKNFTALAARHAGNPRLQLHQAAVDLSAGRRTIYDIAPALRPRLPDWAGGLASFDRTRVLTAAHELGLADSDVVVEEIATKSWTDVWATLGGHRCDVLVLDTEGYDFTLLRAAGLERQRPRIIHFEHACHTADERFAFYRELVALGYELATDGGDTTAWLPA